MSIAERCIDTCGPYQGYYGRAEYDDEAKLFHGEVIGTRDVITFQGRSVEESRRAFKASVDDYLEFCEERGEQPEKPFSGKFVLRVEPEFHHQLSVLAEAAGKSLNQYVLEALLRAADESKATRKRERGVRVKKASAKRRTRRGRRKVHAA